MIAGSLIAGSLAHHILVMDETMIGTRARLVVQDAIIRIMMMMMLIVVMMMIATKVVDMVAMDDLRDK